MQTHTIIDAYGDRTEVSGGHPGATLARLDHVRMATTHYVHRPDRPREVVIMFYSLDQARQLRKALKFAIREMEEGLVA